MANRTAAGLAIIICFAALGCGKNEAAVQLGDSARQAESIAEEQKRGPEEGLKPIDRKIIKEGTIQFECSDVEKTRMRIERAVQNAKGYISQDNGEHTENSIRQTVEIRVPAENFDRLVAEISKGVRDFELKNIKAIDVTEEYLDISARIQTKKELENRYRELLARANTVAEILAIEKQIGELRTDIESIEGRLKYLENRVSYSTLIVTFYEEIPSTLNILTNFKNGLQNGWNGFLWFLVALVNIWPLFAVASITLLIIFIFNRAKKKKAK